MTDRWVCKRCYADNEGTATACARCGLQRGADVSLQAQQTWQAQAQPAEPAPAWRGLLRYAWIPVVGIVLAVGFVLSQGQRDLENLAVGNCFNAEEAEEISSVEARDCDEPHRFEVVHVVDWPNPDDPYPNLDAQDAFLVTECGPAFASYVGTEYLASSLELWIYSPPEEGWSQGDHEFVCAVYDPADNELDSSVRDSGL
jgi:hypothetical protein